MTTISLALTSMAARFDNSDGRLRGRNLQSRRLRKWTNAEGLCAMCGALTRWPDGFQLDHIVALHKGGEDTEEQTQVLCFKCHDEKTMRDMGLNERLKFGPDGRVQW